MLGLSEWIADRWWRYRAAMRERYERPWIRTARAHGLFAGYADWVGVLAVDAGGEVWFVEHGQSWTAQQRVLEPELRHAARASASRRYARVPELRYVRPQNAQVCSLCHGSGVPDLPPKLRYFILCQCGGCGWLPESWDATRTSAEQWTTENIERGH